MRKKRGEGMRIRREKREKTIVVIDDKEEEKEEKGAAAEQQPETPMDPVDELVSSLHHPSDKPIIQQPRKLSSSLSSSAATTPTRPPRATTSNTFETAHKTTTTTPITHPSLPNPSHPPHCPPTTAHPPITVHTALHSNPPTSTDITHARALTAKHAHSHSHTTHNTPARVSGRNPDRNTLATLAPAVVVGQQQQQRTTLTRYVSKARRTKRAVGRGFARVFFGW